MSEPEYIAFVARGKAEPAGSKLPGRAKSGRLFVRDDNPKAKQWQRLVAAAAGEAMAGRELMTGPLRLRLFFVVRRPGGHWTTKGALSAEGRRRPYPDRRPDLTKLIRAVEDALTEVVWRNDEQVVQQEASKVYGDPPRCEVEVEPARPARPYEGDPQQRLDRLEDAIGPENGLDPQEQLGTVLRLIERQDLCRCGGPYDPLARSCALCGRATFSQYAPARRAAGAPLEPETPQIARFG
jgi:Holliday junction resolvase RusA-like endonuclease